jgi:hypothetical protein
MVINFLVSGFSADLTDLPIYNAAKNSSTVIPERDIRLRRVPRATDRMVWNGERCNMSRLREDYVTAALT